MTNSGITCLPINPLHIHRRLRLLLLFAVLLSATPVFSQAATLTAFATLPADTFAPGPMSGQSPEPTGENRQPVQGFSALLEGENGSFIVLSDNGYGRRDNSASYFLSIYHLFPDFRTASGGSGEIRLLGITYLSDPWKFLPYPASRKTDRLLTGADLDPESFRLASDGSYWIGEEFNPALVHFDAGGRMLAPPFTVPGLASEHNPAGIPATLPRSRGYEGMALSVDGKRLYPMLEGAVSGQQPGLNIYTFDIENERFLNAHADAPSFRYRLDAGATAIGDFTLFSEHEGLVIERDSAQGDTAVTKKIYRINFEQTDREGFLIKTPVADLLAIDDPHDLNNDGNTTFRFAFWTIEGLVILNATTLGLVNDNNYPLGRSADSRPSQAENSEFILIGVEPLWAETSGYNEQ